MSSSLLIRFCVFLVVVNPIFSKYVRMTAANEPGQYKKGLKFRGDQAYVADNEIGFDAEPAADGFFEFKFNSDCREEITIEMGSLTFTAHTKRPSGGNGDDKFVTVSTKTGEISGSVVVGQLPGTLSMDDGHVLVTINPRDCIVYLTRGYPVVNDALLGLIGGLTVVQLSLAIALPIIGTAAIILAIIYTIKKLKGYKLKKTKDQESKKNVDKKKDEKQAKKQEKETKQKSKKKLKKANPPQIDFGVLTEKKEKSKRFSGADETVDQAPSKQKSVVIPSLVMKTASIDKKFEEKKKEEMKLDPQIVDSPVAGAQAEKKVEKAGKPSKKSKKRGKKALKTPRTISSGQDEDLKVIDDQWDTHLAKKKGTTTKTTRTLTEGKEDDMVVLDDDHEGDMAKKAAAAAKKKKSRTPTDPSCCAPEDDMAVLDEDWRTAKKRKASPATKTTTKDPSQDLTGTLMGQTLSATLPDNSEERQQWRKEREKAARYRASQDSQEPVIAKRANKKEP